MFRLSSRSLYALSAIYELACHEYYSPDGPLNIAIIAQKQKIPVRFLEGILAQLTRGGFVKSRRGVEGGYQLNRRSKYLTVGEVISFLEGPLDFTNSQKRGTNGFVSGTTSPFHKFWIQLEKSIGEVMNEMTFGNLVEESEKSEGRTSGYVI